MAVYTKLSKNQLEEFFSKYDLGQLVTFKEIKDLKKSSISKINNIAAETSSEVIKQIINTEINKSSVSAIVNEIVKRKAEKYI